MSLEKLQCALLRVRAGVMTFGEFVRETDADWTRMSMALLRRWKCPPHAQAVEDTRQDLLLAAWLFATDQSPDPEYRIEFLVDGTVHAAATPTRRPEYRWDSSRSRLADYVHWNATDKGKKLVHRARGARGAEPYNEQTNLPKLFSAFGGEADDSLGAVERAIHASGRSSAPEQERRLLEEDRAREMRERAAEVDHVLDDDAERLALAAFAVGGSLDAGAEVLYSSLSDRLACELGSERDARRLVGDAVRKAAERLRAA
jgi:hypothetical protein